MRSRSRSALLALLAIGVLSVSPAGSASSYTIVPGGPSVRSGPDVQRGARLAGPAGSIEARARVPPAALIVDDVVTTGATLAACATALRRAGTTEVAAIAFARTPGR